MKIDHWEKIGERAHHGIAIPLFAIHSHKSCGIGEFLDLLPLLDWCRSIGFDCLQLLPLNDTGDDPSPYNPLSSCALDPVYLTLSDLGVIDDQFTPPLNRWEVKRRKIEWLTTLFQKHFPRFQAMPSYQHFVKNTPWLLEYAQYMSLRDQREVDFHCLVQYLCFAQLKKVRERADHLSLFLMGDLPHLVSPESVDVQNHPSLFQRNVSAGAPPDPYNAQGQNWGFPLLNWEKMHAQGNWWWKQRLQAVGPLYHMYRIDHVVGFFRIWGIKNGKPATDGAFYPPDPALWKRHGKSILEMMLNASPLLPIAEDLGTIPNEVYSILKELKICGTKVLRWEMNTPFSRYEPFSMATVSTPDMAPLSLWWEKYPEEANLLCLQKNWKYEKILSQKYRTEILRDAHQTSSYFHINLLQEYLALFPELVWPNSERERINVPGTYLPTNWAYRMRPSIEEICNHTPLKQAMKKIIKENKFINSA